MNRLHAARRGIRTLAVLPFLLSCSGTTEPEITAVDLTVTTAPGPVPGMVLLRATLTNTGTTRVVAYGSCQAISFLIWGSAGAIYHQSPCATTGVACASGDQILDPGETYVQEITYGGIAWTLEFQDTVASCEAGTIDPGSYNVRAAVDFHAEGSDAYYSLLSEPTTFEWNGAAR